MATIKDVAKAAGVGTGTPAKVDEIKAICEEYKVPLIDRKSVV